MPDELDKLRDRLIRRWYELEYRAEEASLFLDELEECCTDGAARRTSFYRVLDREHKLLKAEQAFIENLGISELKPADKSKEGIS